MTDSVMTMKVRLMMTDVPVNKLKQQLLTERVPAECPFCRNIDNVSWTEFKVHLADVGFVQAGGVWQKTIGEAINVFCTRCDEEIRVEDIGVSGEV
jgi:hypothetical protein